eukprot:6683705-Ditylum_brightwellii.AAC.1
MLHLVIAHKPIALLFKQIEDGQMFANAANVPFTNDQLVTYAECLILGTGQDSNVYRSWLVLPVTSRMYQNLKVHFTAKYQLLNKMHQSAQDAGYNSANLATEADAPDVSAQLKEAAQQFAATNAQGQET